MIVYAPHKSGDGLKPPLVRQIRAQAREFLKSHIENRTRANAFPNAFAPGYQGPEMYRDSAASPTI